uniref:Uncharacterized protein n=1 Tax=Ficedula albicollis TaxID=59894 RepID=U3KEB8_FICAL
MSSYFVNSFSGRYPNGPDYQLLNYGTGSSMNGSYRDSSTMHSSSYGYNYNGMDLSINRSASSTHFGAVGESSRGFPSPAQESRFRQASSCSLSPPDSLPCSNSESHGGKPAPSPSEAAPTSASSGADEGTAVPRAQAEPIASSAAAPEGQAPQIFPWMRKLHISHGTATSFSLLVVYLFFFSPPLSHPPHLSLFFLVISSPPSLFFFLFLLLSLSLSPSFYSAEAL